MGDVEKEKNSSDISAQKEEPGLMESYGSFPVWSLKLIDALTPEFLISKEPVEKKNFLSKNFLFINNETHSKGINKCFGQGRYP